MDAKTAFEVESALIDCFGLEHLANEIKGHDDFFVLWNLNLYDWLFFWEAWLIVQ